MTTAAREGLEGARALVTGAHGFLGRIVCERLVAAGVEMVLAPTHDELELRDPTAVARTVCALVSDWLPATTGTVIFADGGASTQLL